MLTKLFSHARHNVVAYLALFVALGGTAYAAAKFTGADVVDNSLTGADVLESSLGKVGDADTLDGYDSTQFALAGGGGGGSTTYTVRSTVGAAVPVDCFQYDTDLYECEGQAPVTASCEAGESATGGGHARFGVNGGEDRPNPTTGTPTGWTVDMRVHSAGPDHPASLPSPPVYVICAS
jgi:hypothetical protein